MSDVDRTEEERIRDAELMRQESRYWWIFLVTGAFWLLFSVAVFRFEWSTVSSISILFGVVMIAAAAEEVLRVPGASTGWKIAHAALAVAFVVIGVVSFIHPGNTFAALAGVMSFYFVVSGFFDVFAALSSRGTEGWWLRLAAGIAELLLGFWAAGDFGHKTILLVVWVGAAALARGITQLVFAFALRSAKSASLP